MAEEEAEEVPLKILLKHAVEQADLPALKEAHQNGQNLSVVLDDNGNTPLSCAINLGIDDVVDFLLEVLGPQLSQDEMLTACLASLDTLSSTRDTHYLDLLHKVLSNQRKLCRRHIPYVIVLQAAFKILRPPPKDLLVKFCEMVLRLAPELCRDVSLNLVLYDETEVYWQLLSRGMSLNDIWPVHEEQDREGEGVGSSSSKSGDSTLPNLFDVYFTYGCLLTLHTFSRNRITRMTIQAANGSASAAVLHVIQNFPTDLHDDVFKYLMLAGFTLTPSAMQRMASANIDKAAQLLRWYKDFRTQPCSLKHLCRLCVRSHLQTNVAHAVSQILLPEDLKRYLLITDPNSL